MDSETRLKWEHYAIIALVVALAFEVWKHNVPEPQPVGEYHAATFAPQVKDIPKVMAKVSQVEVYSPAAAARLKLPDSMKEKPVVAATECKSDPRPQTIVTVIDPSTGKSDTVVRAEAYRFLAAENVREAMIAYGYRNDGRKVARMAYTHDLVQMMGWNVGGYGTLDMDGKWFAGVSVAYRW